MKTTPLFLFVGRSASGKTTIANMLETEGYTQIKSYTTRKPRYEGEKEHTFITEEEYFNLENIMAYTFYNNHHYCTTLDQIKNADIYVVDVPGVKTLLENYHRIERDIYVVYFESNVYNRIQRMIEREDSDTQVVGRLLQDEKENWLEQLMQLNYINFGFVTLKVINANSDLEEVYNDVKNFIKEVESNEEH